MIDENGYLVRIQKEILKQVQNDLKRNSSLLCRTRFGISNASAVIDALRADGETVYIHPETSGCSNVEMDGYVVIEKGNRMEKGIPLRNCIVLQGSKTEQNSIYENCILSTDFRIDLDESEILSGDDNGILIGTGGSARKYYRVKENDKTKVLMQCNESDKEYSTMSISDGREVIFLKGSLKA